MFSEMNMSYIYHYVLFGCLLLVVLIDYKHVLVSVETPTIMRKKEPKPIRIASKEPAVHRVRSLFSKDVKYNQTPQAPVVTAGTYEFKEVSDNILSKMQAMLEDLERKTLRIEKLENTIEERRRNLVDQEKMLTYDVTSYLKLMERMENKSKYLTPEVSSVDKMFIEGKVVDHLVIEKTTECAAIIQKGVLKKINHSFADFLSYGVEELVNKSLFVFIAYEGMEAAKKYYLGRLKGVASRSYKTVFLTKDNQKVPVEITIEPTMYNGEVAEIIIVKEIENE
jgi:PAS domain S-box-containing protein